MLKSNFSRSALVAGLGLVSAGAYAQAVPAFTTAITNVTADIATYGGALVGVAAVGVAFMVGMKYVKKIRSAA